MTDYSNVEMLIGATIDSSIVSENNDWTSELETIVKGWIDIATCYRYLHDATTKNFNTKKLAITIPTVILSTISGASSIFIQKILSSANINTNYINIVIGIATFFAGLLTVLGNNLGYAGLEQAHSTASLNWGTFKRVLSLELDMIPSARTTALNFMKSRRAELNKLIEQTPEIPYNVFDTIEQHIETIVVLNTDNLRTVFENVRKYESSDTHMNLMIESTETLVNKIHVDTPITPVTPDISITPVTPATSVTLDTSITPVTPIPA